MKKISSLTIALGLGICSFNIFYFGFSTEAAIALLTFCVAGVVSIFHR